VGSNALASFLEAIKEIQALQKANPSPNVSSPFDKPAVKRAIGRSQVVLLSSHYERYLYEVNEEATTFLCAKSVEAEKLPLSIRLRHARSPVDDLFGTAWNRRDAALRSFAVGEATMWIDGAIVSDLDAARLLEWMKAPSSKNVQRYFRQWGLDDIFSAVTRKDSIRADFWLRLDELVDKRNNIAHGDLTVEATHLDVVRFLAALRKFVPRIDACFGRVLGRLAGGAKPW
jgi:hypothetical protein